MFLVSLLLTLLPPPPAAVYSPPPLLPQVEEYADEVFDLLDNGAHMYFCGLKGMMPGILDMLKRVSEEKGRNFDEFVEALKHKNQWHVSVVAWHIVEHTSSWAVEHNLCWAGCVL